MKKNIQNPLYEQVLKKIEGQIVSGVYRKGDLLPSEKELIESFGVSRITVRKALAILAEMGMIETSKGRGSIVLFSQEDACEQGSFAEAAQEYQRSFRASTQIRLMMEPEIARQAALKATPEQVEHLKECMKIGEKGEPYEDFHIAVAAILDNKELIAIIGQLFQLEESFSPQGLIPPERQQHTSRILEAQHERIVKAIEENDAEFAYFYMKEHTRYVAQMYEEYFRRMN